LQQVLSQALKSLPVDYQVYSGSIVLTRSTEKMVVRGRRQESIKSIRGLVVDESGEGLSGVSVRVKDSLTIGTVTGDDGRFRITAVPGDTLLFSYMGYEPLAVAASSALMRVAMKPAEGLDLDEVVVVG